jgi:Fe-S oxidoreductase
MTLCREVPQYARLLRTFIEGEPNAILITEFYGENEAELKTRIDNLKAHLKKQHVPATAIVPALDPQKQTDVWTVRKVGLGLLMSIKGDHKPIPFIEDAAVPVEHLAEYVTKLEDFCTDIGTQVAYYAHASAGCVHIRPLINAKAASEVAKLPEISTFSVELLKGYGGALSSEHGDGRARSWQNERFFGPDLYRLFQDVKRTFDPDNIFNPGNIVDAGPMTENLRYGETYEVIPIQPHIDFSTDQGFHRAVEMCNGAGVCRKQTTGTMCPSFMVTREEEHSTRGRANALRAAMSGVLPMSELTSKRMYRVLDLCISCKACKAECPSSVDMAKIKFEFLAQYHDAHGTSLRDRLFGDIACISRLNSGPQAMIVNWLLRNPIARALMEKLMGISRARTLPPFARQSFTSWFRNHNAVRTNGTGKQVVLFNDTFNTYNYPQTAIAATEVLEALGYDVVLPGHRCCGRPMISKGLVEQARGAASDVVERLAPYAQQGIPIVGLEPSCILSLRDEYHDILPGDARVYLVAGHAYTFEEFIAKLADEGELTVDFTDEPRKLLLHGHCHQKALVGTGPSKRALTLPPGYSVDEVD